MSVSSKRLHELDGLRGIAAMWVVFYHFWGAIQERDVDWVPEWIGNLFKAGFLGVDIFFVLSGFVIMHSVSNAGASIGFIPRFMLRRSVRIDPPYWGAIALAIILMFLKDQFFPASDVTIPSISTVIAHLFYLQDILELKAISSVFWTLCIEFQFYLIFCFTFFLYINLDDFKKRIFVRFCLVISIIFCFVSPVLRFSSLDFPVPGTIFPFAYEFIIGVMAYFWIQGTLSGRIIFGALLASVIPTIYYMPLYYALTPVLVLGILFLSSKGDALSWMRSKIMLFLGRISYSLYLIHASVGWVSLSLMMHFSGQKNNEFLTVFIFIAGVVFSIAFATIFNFLLETPSKNFSKKFRVGKVASQC
jgi:peptidoglycan/LPS O-acetylase OafA/YrhL